MITWKNMDTLASYEALKATTPVALAKVMSGENGAERVKKYTAPMGAGLNFNYGARPVDESILEALAAESYYNLMPAFCETVLKDKYSRDTDSAEMLDLILSSLYQDLSDAIWVEARSSFLPLFEAGKTNFASEAEKVAKKINKQINNYIKKAEKIIDGDN